MDDRRQITFSVSKGLGTRFEAMCAAKGASIVETLVSMVARAVEAHTGIAEPDSRPPLTGFSRQLLEAIDPGESVTVAGMSARTGSVPMTVRYALKALLGRGLVEEAGAVRTGSRYAESYRLTALGQTLKLIAPAPELSLSEKRAGALVFLINEGVPPEVAKKAIEDEEMTAHIGDYKMDYSLDFWKEWLACQRES